METNQSSFAKASADATPSTPLTQEEILAELLENSRATKKYMKWQLYITLALVVLPIIAMLVIIPMVLSSIGNITSIYTGGM